jgi:hypothetical protein
MINYSKSPTRFHEEPGFTGEIHSETCRANGVHRGAATKNFGAAPGEF